MKLEGERYSRRLESFSNFTLVLISGIGSISSETSNRVSDIASNSGLTEEQVIEKLLELKNIHSESKMPITYDDVLGKVCDALEEGFFLFTV